MQDGWSFVHVVPFSNCRRELYSSPKILRSGGLAVVIYTRDHLPPHVHVFNADGECVINLGDSFRAPTVRQVEGMRDRDVVRGFRLVQEQHPFLIRWREIHGS